MKRNKKIKKNAALTSGTWWVVSMIVSMLVMAMIYYVLDSRCDQIAREIGKAEKEYAKLEAECIREESRWKEMSVKEKLDEMITRHGLEMRTARFDSIVHFDVDGHVLGKSRQTIAKAKRMMSGTSEMASIKRIAKKR